MRAIFFMKLNNKTTKVREEEMPVGAEKSQWTFGLVSMNGSLPEMVKFHRVATSLEDTAMFLFDCDTYIPTVK